MTPSFLTSLGDARWFTAGYGFGAPPPGLVTQGLAGSRLLLQGYGPGGSLIAVPASGGLLWGGGAAPSAAITAAAQGGLRFGGDAASALALTCSPPAGGGQGLGGLAATSQALIVSAAGGFQAGGAAPLSCVLAAPCGGGLALGGGVVATDAAIVYRIYANAGAGEPVDYSVPVATVAGPPWTSPALAAPGRYRFAVRAFDAASGLEDRNLDAAVELVLDAAGNDVTAAPPPPLGLRAFGLPGGRLRLEWSCPCVDPARRPEGFRVYTGPPGGIDYSTPAAATPWSAGLFGVFAATLDGLPPAALVAIAVKSFNAAGESPGTTSVTARVSPAPAALVDDLTATATNLES